MKLKRKAMAGWATARIATCGGICVGETRLHPSHTWMAVEGRIRRAFGAGRLVRIARGDGGHNYTAAGSYQVTFLTDPREWLLGVQILEREA